MSAPAELIGIRYSPWTEKARWALDHCEVPYRYHEHLIMLGMPALRLKTGNWSKELTVPALIAKDCRLFDSFDIARYAARHASPSALKEPLFPTELDAEITRLNELSEKALDAGRALTLPRISASRAARLENVPPFIPRPLRPFMSPLVGMGIAYVRREFAVDRQTLGEYERTFRAALEELSRLLSRNGGEYLFGRFTYADIAGAAILQFVKPVDSRFVRLGPASRESWQIPGLAEEFPELVRWRNALYEKRRRSANS